MRNRGIIRNTVVVILMMTLCLTILPRGVAFGQEAPAEKPEPAADSTDATAASDKSAEKPEVPKTDKDNNLVALNLNKVNIDKVLKFLSELTGKPVTKTKDVKAEITITSAKKVTRQDAVRMIVEQLRLEKIAVVDRKDYIQLIPEARLTEMDIPLALTPSEVPVFGDITKAIPIRFIDTKDIEKTIKPLLSKNAIIIAPPGAKKIVVTDTVDRIANLERVLAQLDVLDVDDRQVQIFPLEHADAEKIAPIIRAIMTGDAKDKPKKDKQAAGDAVSVQVYKSANWLIVICPKEKLDEVAKLVVQLDRDMPQELKLRIIEVEYADADDLARQLSSVMKQRREKRDRDIVEIIADTRSNSLLVLSSEANYNIVVKVIKQLDNEESVEMKTKWFELKHADAEDMAEQMNDLYSGLDDDPYGYSYWYRPRQQKARTRFVAEPRTNSLIAIAPPNEFPKIQELVNKLDLPIDAEQAAPRIFLIKYIDAKELTEVLNKVFGVEDTSGTGGYYSYLATRYGSGESEVGRLHGKVRFDPLPSTNSIIVTTNNVENFPIIAKFIAELDQIAPEAANLLRVPLKNARAEDVAKQLNILFAQEGARAPEKKDDETANIYTFLYGSKKKDERPISNLIGRVRVVPDVRTNSLLITTAVQNHGAIIKLIAGLDADTPKVYIEVRLVEIIRTKASRIGTRISSEPTVFETEDFDTGLKSTLGFDWSEVHGNGVIDASLGINVLVQFLARNYDMKILADTAITINNNKEGTIFVGSEIPFIENSQVKADGTRNDSFKYRNAGTELKITPNINQDNRVVMDIHLESSQIRSGEELLGAYILDTRKFQTMLAVENRQTVVMGGIMREQEVEGNRGVPILRHIPIVNWVFGKRDKEHQLTELVAFITPSVTRTPEEDAAKTRETKEGLRERYDWQPLNDEEGSRRE